MGRGVIRDARGYLFQSPKFEKGPYKRRKGLIWCLRYLTGYRCNSAPCTPGTMSIQASTEDLIRKRSSTPTLDTMLKKSAITLSEYLALNRLPEAKPVDEEPEVFMMKDEKEGKMKGALKAMKKYEFFSFNLKGVRI